MDRLSETEIRRWLAAKELGESLEIHTQLDSTNNRAKELASQGAPHGMTIIADSQTGGRGRMGRSFFSPEHSGIYMTVILRPRCSPEKAGMLTSLAAVAAAGAVEKVSGADVKIKWVNDLYIGGKKICGILSEAGLGPEAGRPDWVVVGIGINTAKMLFPEELKEIASSVGNETGEAPNRNRLIAEILNELDRLYGSLETGAFLEESRRRSNVIGREITVVAAGEEYPAKALDIDEEGRLVVETAEGQKLLNSGEVSLRLKKKEVKA